MGKPWGSSRPTSTLIVGSSDSLTKKKSPNEKDLLPRTGRIFERGVY